MKYIISSIVCLLLMTGVALSQDVVVPDFPLGIGSGISQDFFKPYYSDLKAISDTLQKYPLTLVVVTGGADGNRYRRNNDANNPALALGRAHALRNFLIQQCRVDSMRILIQSEDVPSEGPRYRYARARIVRDLSDIEARLAAVENQPPLEKHFTEIREITGNPEDNLGLQFSLGLSSSPFGGIPIVAGAVSWKNFIYAEGVLGHTFWNNTFRYGDIDLNTRRRLAGGQIIVYPFENTPVGILGGWVRIEQISQDYYKYVKMSEGPVLGLRASPHKFISVTAAYNPSMRHFAGDRKSNAKNDQFLLSVSTHLEFGGKK